MAERPVLLTVSGRIPCDLDEQVAAGRRPGTDYTALARELDADLIDVDRALVDGGRPARVLYRLGGAGLLLGWYCHRRRNAYSVILTDGEQVGLPLALFGRLFGRGSARHVMIVHILSVPKKSAMIRLARLSERIDRYVVYCSAQRSYLVDHLGVPAERVVLSTFTVDSEFFAPHAVSVRRRRMICSAGLERRDYVTLMEAVDGLDVEVVIAAASPWSTQPDSSAQRVPPSNVTIRQLDLFELRELYAASAFVVMPLLDVDFQAGITTILEAMSMERAVVCSRTPGQTDTIVDDVTGVYVPVGDPSQLRDAIVALLDDLDRAARLGSNARQWVLDTADLRHYAAFVASVAAEPTSS